MLKVGESQWLALGVMLSDQSFSWWFPCSKNLDNFGSFLEFGLRKTPDDVILLFIVGTEVVIEEIIFDGYITNISKDILSMGWEAWKGNHFQNIQNNNL